MLIGACNPMLWTPHVPQAEQTRFVNNLNEENTTLVGEIRRLKKQVQHRPLKPKKNKTSRRIDPSLCLAAAALAAPTGFELICVAPWPEFLEKNPPPAQTPTLKRLMFCGGMGG